MEKTAVVALRDALLQDGKNKTLRIAFDNGINFTLSSDLVLWDDEKEIVVGLIADSDSGSFEAGLPIRVITSTYENIQFIMGNTNVKNLEGLLDSLKSAMTISEENKAKILKWYNAVYDYRKPLSRTNYNPTDIIRGDEPKEEGD